MAKKIVPGTGGDQYVPYENRTGAESVVYFTRDLSAEGLLKIYDKISSVLEGKIAVKLHTGEPNGPNIIPRPWVKELLEKKLKDATVVETNAYYEGGRYTTEEHRKTLEVNGWTDFTTVDILDEEGTVMFPVKGGKWFTAMSMGSHLSGYDSFLALTHFKGHAMGGFGGANKNIGIGCADGRIGKAMIHTRPGEDQWGIDEEELMERMAESTKATIDHFAGKIAYINVMRNISVSCDCEGTDAEPVVTPNIGIAASLDILAVDNAGVDMIFSLLPGDRDAMVERITSRHGLRQLSFMKELGMGNDRYELIDIDNGDVRITAQDAVKDVVPFEG
ncbi:MAG: DUF362 domain-containing protein [Lachnospiraceae bacterium]|nr:DUF362 domain-containing protein [Lachnospiraceae bacterium]